MWGQLLKINKKNVYQMDLKNTYYTMISTRIAIKVLKWTKKPKSIYSEFDDEVFIRFIIYSLFFE